MPNEVVPALLVAAVPMMPYHELGESGPLEHLLHSWNYRELMEYLHREGLPL